MGNVWSNAEPKSLLIWKYTEGPDFQSHAQIQKISYVIMAAHSAA